jgi:hemerythrin-like domain-containing protein
VPVWRRVDNLRAAIRDRVAHARDETMEHPSEEEIGADDPASLVAAREAALEHIRREHRSLARVIESVETITAEIIAGETAPDFVLLCALLYYVDAVPERLHHPKEDRFLFAALRRLDPESAPLVDRLQRDHARSPLLVAELERALVHWQGGAADGADRFALALGTFCEFHWNHMRTEETEVLPRATRCLREQDWTEMAEAFGDNLDPLFGSQRRHEFERLYHRIANLAPRKLRLGLLKHAPDRE